MCGIVLDSGKLSPSVFNFISVKITHKRNFISIDFSVFKITIFSLYGSSLKD